MSKNNDLEDRVAAIEDFLFKICPICGTVMPICSTSKHGGVCKVCSANRKIIENQMRNELADLMKHGKETKELKQNFHQILDSKVREGSKLAIQRMVDEKQIDPETMIRVRPRGSVPPICLEHIKKRKEKPLTADAELKIKHNDDT